MADEKARQPTKEAPKPVNIPLSKIHDLPGSVFAPPDEKSLSALTSSIVLKGVQEPVILRQREDGEFQIVSGNRRRKASELAKKTEIPAFVYDMTEKEAKDFRFRDKGAGTPPGKLLPENEIGKKREEKVQAAASAEKTEAADAKLSTQQKSAEKSKTEKSPAAPETKKPDEAPNAKTSSEKANTDSKIQTDIPKQPEKTAEGKSTPTPAVKKSDEPPKVETAVQAANADIKKSDAPSKPPEKAAEVKAVPAQMSGPAALGPTGTKITKIFEDRLMPPDEKAMKELPVPKDGESYFITLHPAYLEKSKFNTVSVDTHSEDFLELKKSIELNGVKDPVLTRLNPEGGLEILSGQRRHMIARELNYPVPAIIQKIDDNDAMILVADSNLHRPHISTYDLSRTLRNKMTAMKRKAGRKKRGEVRANELDSDERLAKEMGISVSKLNRIVRLSEATKSVCEAVDDNSLELSIASALSFLTPKNQDAVIDLMGIGYKPNMKRVQRLRDAEKAEKLDDQTMRRILNDQDIQPPEPPKPVPTPTPLQAPAAPPAASTPAIPVKQEASASATVAPKDTPVPVSTALAEKSENEPKQTAAVPAEASTASELKKPNEEPIEFNSQRDNLYATKVTLGGDRLRRYFPDTSMTPLAIVESIYSALEERRQREERMKQKTEILRPNRTEPGR